jgi:predicted ATPase
MRNRYLLHKEIVYDKGTYTCRFELLDGPGVVTGDEGSFEISLESLSSGEKQIVGLFSKLILEDVDDLFVIIDEPEISLSMDWQAMLLPDVTKTCNFGSLIAATHSPFVSDNELVDHAHGLNEFLAEARPCRSSLRECSPGRLRQTPPSCA